MAAVLLPAGEAEATDAPVTPYTEATTANSLPPQALATVTEAAGTVETALALQAQLPDGLALWR